MASSTDFEKRVSVSHPVVIVGLPGVGNVGKLAADLMAEELDAEVFARIYSSELPPQILVNEDCTAEPICIKLSLARTESRDIIFILGESQATTPSGQHDLTGYIFDVLLPYDPSLIVTLGGYGTGELKQAPRILGVVTDACLKPDMEKAGIGFYDGEPKGGVVGAAALFLTVGKRYGVPAMSIIGETSGYIVDHRSASLVVHAVNAIIGTDADTSKYSEFVDMIEEASMAPAQPEGIEAPREDLSYIQ